jgi:surface protein
MFQNCKKLTTVPNINGWDVSNVKFMSSMFNGTKFNQNIGSWNTSNALNMRYMFRNSSFNQDISGWNTEKVGSMLLMFDGCTAFNQNLGNWSLKACGDITGMLNNAGMDCNNYSATLIGWSQNTNTPNNLTLGASGLKYGSYATTDRTNLDDTKNWTITDGGQGSCSAPQQGSVQMIDFGGFIKHDVTNLDKPLNVYPNPATDLINLEFKGIAPSTFNVLVMDMSGKVIIKLNGVHAESNLYTLPLNGIVSGMYVVKLSDELGNTTINRFNIK